jgi:hypothetical protein
MSDERSAARSVVTAPFRMSFPNLLKPRETEENGVKKSSFELNLLFPPNSDLEPLKAALKAGAVDKWGADMAKWPKLKRGPKEVLRDFADFNTNSNKPLAGDWTGWVMVRARATVEHPPTVIGPVKGADGKFPVITDPREVYSGRWARAKLDAFAYDRKDGKGVSFGLINVQLLKHDTKFGGAVSDPNKDFDEAPEEWRGDTDDFGKQPETAGSDW